jgi:hypothetical protein
MTGLRRKKVVCTAENRRRHQPPRSRPASRRAVDQRRGPGLAGPAPGKARWAVAPVAVVALVLAPVGGQTPATPAEALAPATDLQVQAFLTKAQAGLNGTFSASYSARAGTKPVSVYGAQIPDAVTMYRETPPIAWFGPPGQNAPASYEVFEVFPKGDRAAGVGDGFYTCTLGAIGGHWSCRGPYLHVGMGTTFQLTAPYPPPELARGLSNSAHYYLGLGGAGRRPSEKAYIFSKGPAGHAWECLGFGSARRLVGSACLGPHELVSYYQLPRAATVGTYIWAKMLSFSLKVQPGAFHLPARPVPPGGGG